MDDDLAIKVEHVSKKYCRSLTRSMWYGIKDIARNAFGLSAHSYKLRKGEFWAVDDVSFEVRKGEIVGIIGPNGSGKTTLLKMINGIFWPDKGKITVRGHVGALIEVGAGFHPNLTGKENIYVNGAILGMTKEELDEKYDDIVEFADIGDFIGTPVKYYSSGMFVRLGFAVAAHCRQDILLVDEVLAVGDNAFRRKCYQKMNEIKSRNNVAIVFVSHNLLTVERFCDRGIFLNFGKIESRGEIHKVIRDYQVYIGQLLDKEKSISGFFGNGPYCTKEAIIKSVKYLDKDGNEQREFSTGDTLGIRIEYEAKKLIRNPIFQISLVNLNGVHVFCFGTHIDKIQIKSIEGRGVVECWIENLPLLWNKYYLTVAIYDETHNITFDYRNDSILNRYFQVLPGRTSERLAEYTPICQFPTRWKMNGEVIPMKSTEIKRK